MAKPVIGLFNLYYPNHCSVLIWLHWLLVYDTFKHLTFLLLGSEKHVTFDWLSGREFLDIINSESENTVVKWSWLLNVALILCPCTQGSEFI